MFAHDRQRATPCHPAGAHIRSVNEADVAWFDANLAADFFNTNPDGTFVLIRILGDFAIIHARYQKPDGTQGAGRNTDDWQLRDGRWQCVSAHVSLTIPPAAKSPHFDDDEDVPPPA
jgi:hypothetical protein